MNSVFKINYSSGYDVDNVSYHQNRFLFLIFFVNPLTFNVTTQIDNETKFMPASMSFTSMCIRTMVVVQDVHALVLFLKIRYRFNCLFSGRKKENQLLCGFLEIWLLEYYL